MCWLGKEGGWHDVQVEVVEKFPCDSKEELEEREKEWILEMNPELNSNVPRRTLEEYKKTAQFKNKKREQDKKYNKENKETIKEKNKIWREANIERLKASRQSKEYKEYKEKKNERRRNTIHHCDVCNVDIKGGISAFKAHCNRPIHIEKSNPIL